MTNARQGNEGRRNGRNGKTYWTKTGPAPYCRLYSLIGDLVPSV